MASRSVNLSAGQREALAAWKAAPTTLRALASQLGLSVGKAHGLAKAA